MARDSGALTDECEYFDEPDIEMKKAAQRTICRFADDAAEALMFMKMLGVDPQALKETEMPVRDPVRLR